MTALLSVFNEFGQVVTQSFVVSTGFADVKSGLEGLKKRYDLLQARVRAW